MTVQQSKASKASKSDAAVKGVANTVHVPTDAECAEITARVSAVRQQGADYVAEASRLTLAVFDGGFIGKGRLYAEQGDYAKALGVSDATISGWLTYGRALALGMSDADLKTVYANRQSVGKALKGATSKTAASKALKVAVAAKQSKADAAKRSKATAATIASTTPPVADKGAGKATAAMDNVTVALDILRRERLTLTDGQRSTVAASLSTLLAEYGQPGAGRVSAPTAKATPATVAAKVAASK